MKSNNKYIFKSVRLGFRNWDKSDLEAFSKLNADPEVMAYFPKTLTSKETADFIERLQNHYIKNGYNYFATEILETGEFIGFIGLAHQNYESDFTPATDIGWRLKQSAWRQGYATEGAKKCLEFAFETLKLNKIIATCTVQNFKSELVMKKLGMKKLTVFNHPNLKEYPEFQKCICYEISKTDYI
ncbi:GNAT family N-acetyltransferase [Tamlana sp. 2_MG-2023]|uniref:GNAT family N-acetyltransferase n=1 Tax=unclassified Tamlana TaxID=2614803 RepID=UPI0026E2AD52|nr:MULTISPECIES: GNAT family N-acetyltransferase [unclassified Tamlana]MDO6759370.1 GNAT family N-acetyltransferase [Tamlana sp. 2_MG-2023]MDO6790491.1 GNAT family N-acetyltransferase [Tamlana sp. 1_MG-2023]